MSGDEQARACQLCHLTVYNVSQMSRREAENFLRERIPEQKLCLKIYRRQDGTIITDDCPRSLRKARDFSLKIKMRFVAALALFVAWWSQPATAQKENRSSTSGTKAVSPPEEFMGKMIVEESEQVHYYKSKLDAKIKSAWHHKAAKSEKAPKVIFQVDKDGHPSGVKISLSSGNAEVDREAVKTIEGLVFDSPPADEVNIYLFTLESAP
jgi:TonB family protein